MLGTLSAPLTVTALGRTREYYVHFPTSYDATRAYPVVFVFHGDSNLADLPKGLTGRGFFAVEEMIGEEVIVVYMDGENLYQGGDMNTSTGQNFFLSWDLARPVGENPDFAYFDAVLAQIRSDYCVDENATFAVGFSGGGFFTNSLACLNGGLDAVVTFEAGFDNGEFEASNAIDLAQCSASPPAALIIHSPADATVNFETFATLERDYYKEANQCEDVSSVSSINSNCTEFASGNARVVFCDPACTVDIDGDGVCTDDQHSVWNITDATGKRQGPEAMKTFLQRFY